MCQPTRRVGCAGGSERGLLRGRLVPRVVAAPVPAAVASAAAAPRVAALTVLTLLGLVAVAALSLLALVAVATLVAVVLSKGIETSPGRFRLTTKECHLGYQISPEKKGIETGLCAPGFHAIFCTK